MFHLLIQFPGEAGRNHSSGRNGIRAKWFRAKWYPGEMVPGEMVSGRNGPGEMVRAKWSGRNGIRAKWYPFADNMVALAASGGLELVQQILQTYAPDHDIQRYGLSILENLAEYADNQVRPTSMRPLAH
jgi:hypothetical protein